MPPLRAPILPDLYCPSPLRPLTPSTSAIALHHRRLLPRHQPPHRHHHTAATDRRYHLNACAPTHCNNACTVCCTSTTLHVPRSPRRLRTDSGPHWPRGSLLRRRDCLLEYPLPRRSSRTKRITTGVKGVPASLRRLPKPVKRVKSPVQGWLSDPGGQLRKTVASRAASV